MITYKRTTASDPDFQKLIVELDKEFWIRYPDTQQNFEAFNKIDEFAKVIIAYAENTAVGCGCFRPKKADLTIEIKRMYVIASQRNQGIGKKILSALEQWGREEGYKNAILETGNKQPEAIAAYQKSGYLQIPNFPPYEEISESICMKKYL